MSFFLDYSDRERGAGGSGLDIDIPIHSFSRRFDTFYAPQKCTFRVFFLNSGGGGGRSISQFMLFLDDLTPFMPKKNALLVSCFSQ